MQLKEAYQCVGSTSCPRICGDALPNANTYETTINEHILWNND
jgi:hypothetical protein